MAESACRSRDQPDIRARISIHDDSPNDIKEIQIADQTQRALRSKQSWSSPEAIGSLHRAALRKARTLPYPYRPGHFSDIPASDALPCPLIRSSSFTSLSTIQRETEAASLSLHRGSPISAISPSYVAPSWTANIDEELLQDPCPPRLPMRVETLSQQRKIQKLLKKSMRKKDKEQLKAQKEEEQLRRKFLAAEVAAAQWKDALVRGDSIPLRTKSTKVIASQVVKSLSLKTPLSKLGRRVKRSKSDPPTLDDFDSKQAIREYLNPSPPPPPASAEIAELPAELPQYTPFQDSTRTQENVPVALLEDAGPAKEKDVQGPVESAAPEAAEPQPRPRSMRCDWCKGPIRVNQVYYHCSICDNGDRIVCHACDRAGWSCRHDLTEKIRKVSRLNGSPRTDPSESTKERNYSDAQQQYAAAMWGLNLPDISARPSRSMDSQGHATMSAANPWAYNDISEHRESYGAQPSTLRLVHKSSEDARELEYRRREQEMVFREKEVTFREREAALREKQASIREQEAALQVKQQMFSLQLHTAVGGQMTELSAGVGAQFHDLTQHHNIRMHATKRKAGSGQTMISPANSTGSNQRLSPKRTPSGGRDPHEEDEDEMGGTPKKIKQEADALQTPEKLFACPFCKYDKSKYSEQNVQEKQYRGCSSGYWPDISRLKQHLYRVHWRRFHCSRCYTRFERKDQLDQHRRSAVPCPLTECPYPEKFDEAQYNEIRRKRPASTPEQVWYTIFGILFPGFPQPATPYADNVDMPPAVSPGTADTQDTMDVLGEVFESRLDRLTSVPGQGWLQSAEARQFIREQLRASMVDVLQRIRPGNSPYLGVPSVEVSPISPTGPDSARRSSISLTTPTSSVPPSPVHGPGSANRNGPDSHFLLPGHRQSFSRPFATRAVPKLSTPHPAQKTRPAEDLVPEVTFPVSIAIDPENDQYDEECNSWSHGDERGLAISTDSVPADFDFDFDSAFEDLQKMEINAIAPVMTEFAPVKLASLNETSNEASTGASDLKPKHSTTSSVDSGYGSLGHASSSASASTSNSSPAASRANGQPTQRRAGKHKGKRNAPEVVKESSPVPESAINYEALDMSFHEFTGVNMDLNFDEHLGQYDPGVCETPGDVNVAATNLSAYLDTKYRRNVEGPG